MTKEKSGIIFYNKTKVLLKFGSKVGQIRWSYTVLINCPPVKGGEIVKMTNNEKAWLINSRIWKEMIDH